MLDSWHDFYVILATAAGTLIGAMFIVASIGGRNMTRARAAAIASFVTPTVIHLSVVLLACALLVVPTLDRQTLGIIGVIGGLIGLAAAAHIAGKCCTVKSITSTGYGTAACRSSVTSASSSPRS